MNKYDQTPLHGALLPYLKYMERCLVYECHRMSDSDFDWTLDQIFALLHLMRTPRTERRLSNDKSLF